MKPLLALLAFVSPVLAQEPPAEIEKPAAPDFIRVVEDEAGVRLQTAMTTYEKDGVRVDLIGAVHIADESYYEELNDLFTGYPVLLYEMVGGENIRERLLNPAEVAAPAKNSALSFLGTAYQGASDVLGLTSQADVIDYTAENFVHADLTLAEFQDLQAEKKESLLGILVKASFESALKPQPRPPSTLKLIWGLLKDDPDLLKRQLVHSLAFGDENAQGVLGDSVIIEDRNAKCLAVISAQIKEGRTNIGVFYGAAHFPALDEDLRDQGFVREGQEWLTAWDIPEEPDPEIEAPEPLPVP